MSSWQSWSDFFRMGGYGLYVWGSYGVTFGLLAVEAVQAQRRWRRALEAAHARAATGGRR
jgi:heme exporter protein D